KYFSHLSPIQRLLKDSGLTTLGGREDVAKSKGTPARSRRGFQPSSDAESMPDIVRILDEIHRQHRRFPPADVFGPPIEMIPYPRFGPPRFFGPPPPFGSPPCCPPGYWPFP